MSRQQMDSELTAELQQISTPSNAILHSRLTRFSFRFNEALHFHGSFFFSSNKRLSKCKWTTLLPEPAKKIASYRQTNKHNEQTILGMHISVGYHVVWCHMFNHIVWSNCLISTFVSNYYLFYAMTHIPSCDTMLQVILFIYHMLCKHDLPAYYSFCPTPLSLGFRGSLFTLYLCSMLQLAHHLIDAQI